MPRLFWIVIALIGAGLILLVLNHESGATLGIPNQAFAGVVYLGAWALVVAAAIAGSRIRLGEMARNIALWLVAILLLVASYQYRYELQDIASRLTAGLVPGSPISLPAEDGAAVMVEKRASGHFEVRATVDGAPVDFMIDTGATTTVLTFDDARRAGIAVGDLSFSVPVLTANGSSRAARATAGEIRVATIVRGRVPLLVAEPGRLHQSLLGMNFLGTLSGFDVRGDRIILRD